MADDVEALKRHIEELEKLLLALRLYRYHSPGCPWHDARWCDCGADAKFAEIDKVLNKKRGA